MRQLALVSLAVLALAGCSSYDNRPAAPAPANAAVGAASSNPIDSSGRSDAVTSGSASNTASGSKATQNATPGAVR